MLDCIARIERYCAAGTFLTDQLVQDAVLRNLQVLAESSQRISRELKAKLASVDWKGLAGFRNVLVHDYLGVSMERIWQIATVDLPPLRDGLKGALQDLDRR